MKRRTMTRDELTQRLQGIEWDDFEVKAAKCDVPKDVWPTVSAFSNTSGGWIVFGKDEEVSKTDSKMSPTDGENVPDNGKMSPTTEKCPRQIMKSTIQVPPKHHTSTPNKNTISQKKETID